jgi:hypothetical protein
MIGSNLRNRLQCRGKSDVEGAMGEIAEADVKRVDQGSGVKYATNRLSHG